MFLSEMRFICGQRLQGRTNSTLGFSTATLSLMEHSVTMTTRFGWFSFTQLIMPLVEPEKSASATTSGGHSGCAMMTMLGSSLRYWRSSSGVKRSCTSQRPFQAMILTLVCLAMFLARYSSGMHSTRSVPNDSTTLSAFDEVQQMSLSAFTSADVLT